MSWSCVPGDRVPADTRAREAVNLAIDEAALTGESAPVEKTDRAASTITTPACRSAKHGIRGNTRHLRPRAGHRGRDRHVHRVRADRSGGRDRRGRPHAAAGEPRPAGRTLGKAALVVVALVVGDWPRRAACRCSTCSSSVSPWRSPSFRKRCRRSSRSRSPSVCGEWSSATRSSAGLPSSKRSAAHRSSARTKPGR